MCAVLMSVIERLFPGHPFPAAGDLQRTQCLFIGRRIWRAFVKCHDDIRIQCPLDEHGFHRTEEKTASVDVRSKFHPVRSDFAQIRQTENLKSAGIGQYRLVIGNEFVQTPGKIDDLQPRPQKKVVGVAQNDLRTQFQYSLPSISTIS